MKIYAERPVRAALQLAGDLLLVAWVSAWTWLALQFHNRLDALRDPAVRVGDASRGLADSLSSTSDQIRSLQFVGEVLAAPFDAIVGGAHELVAASDSGQTAIARLADLSIPVIALFPIAFAVLLWITLRGRWMHHASAAAKLRATGYGDGLLAAQALTSARLDQLAQFASPGNPLDDPISRRRLAAYQLRRLGLRGYDSD